MKNVKIKVVTGLVEFAMVRLDPTQHTDGDYPFSYSVTILIPKSSKKDIEVIQNAEREVAARMAKLTGSKSLRSCLRDGDEEGRYPGHYFIATRSKEKPVVVDADLNPLIQTTDLYAGCKGRISMSLYFWNANSYCGVAAGLNSIQRLEEGVRPAVGADFIEKI